VITSYLGDNVESLIPLTLLLAGENGNGKDLTLLRVASELNDLGGCNMKSAVVELADCHVRKGFISIQAGELRDCEVLKRRLIVLIGAARRSGYIPVVIFNEIQGQSNVGRCLLEIINSHHLYSSLAAHPVSMDKVIVIVTCNPHVLLDSSSDITLTERIELAQNELAYQNTFFDGKPSELSKIQPGEVLQLMEELTITVDPMAPLLRCTFADLPDARSTLNSKILPIVYFGHTYGARAFIHNVTRCFYSLR